MDRIFLDQVLGDSPLASDPKVNEQGAQAPTTGIPPYRAFVESTVVCCFILTIILFSNAIEGTFSGTVTLIASAIAFGGFFLLRKFLSAQQNAWEEKLLEGGHIEEAQLLEQQERHSQEIEKLQTVHKKVQGELEESRDGLEEKVKELSKGLEEHVNLLSQREEALRTAQEALDQQEKEFIQFKNQADNDTRQHEQLQSEYQATISDQRQIIEKKQQYVLQLEEKVHDLTYEVKTLLQVGDLQRPSEGQEKEFKKERSASYQASWASDLSSDDDMEEMNSSSDHEVRNFYDATVQLRKCIGMAQKMTGAGHLGGENPRFLGLTQDSYAIDLRRLFDNFQGETQSVVFVYSPNEKRLLFANNQVKGLLGWSPDRFVKDFPFLIQTGFAEWNSALKKLHSKPETHLRLLLKSRGGRDVLSYCHLGVVPSGTFVNQIIGILYPV